MRWNDTTKHQNGTNCHETTKRNRLRWNGRMEWIATKCTGGSTTEWSASESVHELCGNGVWKKRKNFFSYTWCFFLNSIFLLFPELLQGLLTTWQQAKKHTWVHSPNANLKTYAKQAFWSCSLLSPSRIENFTTCSLFSVSLFPCLCCC